MTFNLLVIKVLRALLEHARHHHHDMQVERASTDLEAWLKTQSPEEYPDGKREHTWHTCECGEGTCNWCGGGLGWCTVCNCAEGTLPSHCPGASVPTEQQDEIYAGQRDFKDGLWLNQPSGGVSSHWPNREMSAEIKEIPHVAGEYTFSTGEKVKLEPDLDRLVITFEDGRKIVSPRTSSTESLQQRVKLLEQRVRELSSRTRGSIRYG